MDLRWGRSNLWTSSASMSILRLPNRSTINFSTSRVSGLISSSRKWSKPIGLGKRPVAGFIIIRKNKSLDKSKELLPPTARFVSPYNKPFSHVRNTQLYRTQDRRYGAGFHCRSNRWLEYFSARLPRKVERDPLFLSRGHDKRLYGRSVQFPRRYRAI